MGNISRTLTVCLVLFYVLPVLGRSWEPQYKNTAKFKTLEKSSPVEKKVAKKEPVQKIHSNSLLKRFEVEYKDKSVLKKLKSDALKLSGKAIPTLIKVLKGSKYPDANRWAAAFLIGRIMGDKSGPFLSKFTKHPYWILRLASLKVLLALKQKKYASHYADALNDKSLLVRHQALENISRLRLRKEGSKVWSMLYDKKNYIKTKNGKLKRGRIIKSVIKVIGDIGFNKAENHLLSMILSKKYKDLFLELDYSLGKLTGENSPTKSINVKQVFWKNFKLKRKVI